MTLLIKGMKMPKKCTACTFYYVDFSDGETACLATGCAVSIGEHRDKNCPLVEVPTPHGDLIDRDQVTQLLLNLWQSGNNYTIPDILREIVDIPTIIEAEE